MLTNSNQYYSSERYLCWRASSNHIQPIQSPKTGGPLSIRCSIPEWCWDAKAKQILSAKKCSGKNRPLFKYFLKHVISIHFPKPPPSFCDNEHIHWIGITWNHRGKKQDMSILCRLRLCHLGQDLLLCFGMIALFQIRCQHLGDHTLVHLAVKGGSARDVAQCIHTVRANDLPYGIIRGPSISSIEQIDILMNIVSSMWVLNSESRKLANSGDSGEGGMLEWQWITTPPQGSEHKHFHWQPFMQLFKANPHTNSHWLHSLKASI